MGIRNPKKFLYSHFVVYPLSKWELEIRQNFFILIQKNTPSYLNTFPLYSKYYLLSICNKIYKNILLKKCMLNMKEMSFIILIVLILGFAVSLVKSLELLLYAMLSIFLILIINITAKKVAAHYFESEIEVKLWEIEKYGWTVGTKLKRAFPAGVFFPIIFTAFSFGTLTWMASLVFDVKAKVYRAAKRHGFYSFSEMTEYHIALIAAAGVIANLVFAIIGYLIQLPELMSFSKLSILYVFYNMLPISDLDGNKIFFGSLILWSFLAALTLVGIGYVILMV